MEEPAVKDEAATAARIACRAHAEQVDKAGEPYVDHLERVALRVDPEEQAAAWLHDALEDTDLKEKDLLEAGISRATIASVVTLTRRAGEKYADYIERTAGSGDRTARAVKTADLQDHLEHNGNRIPESLRKRYRKALRRLEGGAA